jgi:hypothetical protein
MKMTTRMATDPTCWELEAGDTLNNGAVVIACEKRGNRVPGDSYAWWTAVCEWAESHHPFVIWTVIARENGYLAEAGSYFMTKEEALLAYEARI